MTSDERKNIARLAWRDIRAAIDEVNARYDVDVAVYPEFLTVDHQTFMRGELEGSPEVR